MQPFPERVRRDKRLQFADDIRVAAECEVDGDAFLDHRHPQLLEPSDLLLRESLEREVGEGWSVPKGKRFSDLRGRGRRVPGRERLSALRDEQFESVQV